VVLCPLVAVVFVVDEEDDLEEDFVFDTISLAVRRGGVELFCLLLCADKVNETIRKIRSVDNLIVLIFNLL